MLAPATNFQLSLSRLTPRRPEVQDHLAAGQPASWLIWEQIWEQHTAKPLQISGMRCNQSDIRMLLSCAFET
jgi:hypothetical protein